MTMLRAAVLLFWALIPYLEPGQCVPLTMSLEAVDTIGLLRDSGVLNTTQCRQDLMAYYDALLQGELWALQMFDASAKFPEAVLTGSTLFLGQFDECLEVNHVSNITPTITGQHCLSYISPPNISEGSLPALFNSVVFRYGMCVPSSCNASDLQEALRKLLNTNVTIPEANCNVANSERLTSGDWTVIGFLCFMAAVVLLSTIYDTYQRLIKNNASPKPVLAAFSAYSNLKSVMSVSGGGQMGCLHGLRTLSMAWVVLCHAYITILAGPATNPSAYFTFIKDITKMVIFNGFVSVDSFFFLSGLLVTFIFFRDITRNGTYDAPKSFIHRYLRLTPAYAAVVLVRSTVLEHLGTGPIYYDTVHPGTDYCQGNWWSGLLYIQNFVDPIDSCLGQAWYLSADMQMFWLGPLVLYPLYIWPVGGAVWLLVLTLTEVALNFGLALAYKLDPSVYFTTEQTQFTVDYVQTHMRATPWLVGAAVAYVICVIKAKGVRVRLSPAAVAVGWLTCTVISLGVIFSMRTFVEADYSKLEAALFLSLHRLGWALGLAWIVLACVYGYGGPINTFLSWNIFQPLGKLSYCVFLIHPVVQLYRTAIIRTNTYFDDTLAVYLFIGDWLLANILAIPLTLAFEVPFVNLDRYLLKGLKILPYPKRQEQENSSNKSSTLKPVDT